MIFKSRIIPLKWPKRTEWIFWRSLHSERWPLRPLQWVEETSGVWGWLSSFGNKYGSMVQWNLSFLPPTLFASLSGAIVYNFIYIHTYIILCILVNDVKISYTYYIVFPDSKWNTKRILMKSIYKQNMNILLPTP